MLSKVSKGRERRKESDVKHAFSSHHGRLCCWQKVPGADIYGLEGWVSLVFRKVLNSRRFTAGL